MWLLAALFGLLMLVALVEHLHWICTSDVDFMMRQCREADAMQLEHITNVLEIVYEGTKECGVPYSKGASMIIASNIAEVRRTLADRRGPPPLGPIIVLEGQTWPFDKNGKVSV